MELKGKKILLTGADGFIGSHLLEQLIEDGHEVRALVYYNSFNSWGWLDTLTKEQLSKVEIISGDIRDANLVRKCVKEMDVVFHLAALIAIPYSYIAPDSYVDTNIRGTLNILQASLDFGISKVLVTSTSEVYGTALYVPIDEKHPKQGQSPYSATKIGADHLAESFYRSFNLPVTIVRPFNTYGPRQSARAIIPACIVQLLSGEKKIKLGALHPTRDLLFVKDTVNGFIEIAKCDTLTGQEVNIATNEEISIKALVDKLIKLSGSSAVIETDQARLRPDKSEVERLLGSNEKICKYTPWKPQHTLEKGLELTLNWFKEPGNFNKYKTNIYNV